MTTVFVTLGTDHHPFDRLIDWVAAARDQLGFDLLVQRGATPSREGVESVEYVGAPEMESLIDLADVVVCHGGLGTMALARRLGHRPIVVPRDPELDEHVDDHQLRHTEELEREGIIDRANSLNGLIALLAAPRPPRTESRPDGAASDSIDRFGHLVAQFMADELPRRTWRQRLLVRRTP